MRRVTLNFRYRFPIPWHLYLFILNVFFFFNMRLLTAYAVRVRCAHLSFVGIWHSMDTDLWCELESYHVGIENNGTKRYGNVKLNDNSVHIEMIWRENACSTRLSERRPSRRALNSICDNFKSKFSIYKEAHKAHLLHTHAAIAAY